MTASAMGRNKHSEPRRIRLVRMAHVYYTHKDIEKARQFLDDFGFQEVKRVGTDTYYRGTGPEPFVYCARQGDKDAFGGAAFVLESEEDLEYASRTLPGASKVTEMTDAPGGGRCVTFRDPVDDFQFHLTYGQRLHDDVKTFPKLKYNFVSLSTSCSAAHRADMSPFPTQPTEKCRPENKFQRLKKGQSRKSN